MASYSKGNKEQTRNWASLIFKQLWKIFFFDNEVWLSFRTCFALYSRAGAPEGLLETS